MGTKRAPAQPPPTSHSKSVPAGWATASVGVPPAPAPTPAPVKDWKQRLLSWQMLVAVAVVLLAGQVVALSVVRHSSSEAAPEVRRELALGRFEFARPATRDKPACRGQVDLAIETADGLTAAQRRQVADAVPALQQAAEEALQRARVADFNDPRLHRLRNQLLDRLNELLGFDGVAEVHAANFHLDSP